MTISKVVAFVGAVSALCTYSFGWSINGVVMSKMGQPLPGVKISCFNYAGLDISTSDGGTFSVNYDGAGFTEALLNAKLAKAAVEFRNNVITISNVNAQSLEVSVMDALGKVAYAQTLRNVFGSVSIDLNKNTAQGAKYLRINSSTYMLGNKVSLLKEGDPMPKLLFAKEGYENYTYEMKSENEKDVVIQLTTASSDPKPASSSETKVSSAKVESSSSVASSSSIAQESIVVDCTGKSYQSGDHKMSVNVDGKNRTFIMHVPSAYKGDKPVALVVDYHPIGGSGQGELSSSPYKGKTDPEGVITLYPDGTSKPGGMGNGWNVGPCCSNDDDVKFSREMIKAVEEKVCIDVKRVYATGFSMGGGMSNHVACNMSDIYAAVAPAAMDLNTTNSAKCNPERPVPIIMFRGTNDPVCRYQGGDSGFNDGLNFLGAEKNFKFWADKNGCTGSPSKNSNGCDEYSNCKDGVKVILCTKQGGGHDYGDANVGWPFLKSYTLP